jgi:hypothetical protein
MRRSATKFPKNALIGDRHYRGKEKELEGSATLLGVSRIELTMVVILADHR